MNKRALVVGMLVACALHLWMVWPLARPSGQPVAQDDAMPPVDSVAVRELPDDQPAEQAPADEAEANTPAPTPEVQLAQAPPADPPPPPPAPAPTSVAVREDPKIESTPAVPDSGPAPLFDPIAAREAVVESAPVSDATMPSAEAWELPPAPSAVAALREPEPPPLPPPPVEQPPSVAAPVLQPTPHVSETSPPPTATRASPALRLRSREMKSWNRDDVLASLPKPDPAFLTASDPRPVRVQPPSPAVAPRTPVAQPAPAPVIELAPRTPVPYTPVKFASLRDRASDRPAAIARTEPPASAPIAPTLQSASAARGRGAEATDRGYLKSLGPAPQDPVARIAWGDPASAMKTLSTGRMALVIVDDDLKVVASIDGSSGAWVRAGLPAQMSTFSNRVRVVDHVSAFAAFARFCQPNEHLAVLVPIGLERRIEGAMDRAARAEGLSRTQVAACYGRLEPRQGALEFVIDRVERRQVQ